MRWLAPFLLVASALLAQSDGERPGPAPRLALLGPKFLADQDWNRGDTNTLIDQLAHRESGVRRRATDRLRALGPKAYPLTLHRANDLNPQIRRALASLWDPFPGALRGFFVEDVSLREACARLTAHTGFLVTADDEGTARVTVKIESGSVWDAVVALARAAHVGLKPHHQTFRSISSWPAGVRGDAIVLGSKFPRLKNAHVAGPVLVQLSAHALDGERAGVLRITMRTLPEVPILGVTKPIFDNAEDGEG